MAVCFFATCFGPDSTNSTSNTSNHKRAILEFADPVCPTSLALSRASSVGSGSTTINTDESNSSNGDSQRLGFIIQQGLQHIFHHGKQLNFAHNDDNDDNELPLRGEVIDWHASPLRSATQFNCLNDIPTIALDECVMPGGLLQRQMSIRLKESGILAESDVDECVICMEAFDDSNPRMSTHCACGKDKTFFHLPCLYQWIDKCKDCPSCRKKLTWKEL